VEINKRVSARQNFDLPFSFEISAIEGKVKNVKQNGTGVDISSCGLGMKTKYALRQGSVLKFFLPMRKLEVTIPVFAQVMWSMPANDHFRVGLRFLS
jgi:hypothetical protein